MTIAAPPIPVLPRIKISALEVAAGAIALAIALPLIVVTLNLAVPRSETWALSAGSMTLVGELRDSVSGETLVRFYDHDTAREYSGPRRIEFGYNEIEARKIARQWAQALRAGMQAARAAAPVPAAE